MRAFEYIRFFVIRYSSQNEKSRMGISGISKKAVSCDSTSSTFKVILIKVKMIALESNNLYGLSLKLYMY